MTVTLEKMTPATRDPLTAGLVDAILKGDQASVDLHTNMIYARNDMRQLSQNHGAVQTASQSTPPVQRAPGADVGRS